MVERIGVVWARRRPLPIDIAVAYLVIGLLFQVLYHGFPWPFSLGTWLHVLVWPVFVVFGLLRWVFYPIAMLALIGLALAYFHYRRRA